MSKIWAGYYNIKSLERKVLPCLCIYTANILIIYCMQIMVQPLKTICLPVISLTFSQVHYDLLDFSLSFIVGCFTCLQYKAD